MSNSAANLLDAAIEIKNVNDLVGRNAATSPMSRRHGRTKLKTLRRAEAASPAASRSSRPCREARPVRASKQPDAFGSRARQILAEAYAVVSLLTVIGLLLYKIIA